MTNPVPAPTPPYKPKLRQDLDDLVENGQLGDWAFNKPAGEKPDYIFIRLPNPNLIETTEVSRGEVTPWPLKDQPDPIIDDWQWDGNREAPTLKPSLNYVGIWHGYMKAGVLEKA